MVHNNATGDLIGFTWMSNGEYRLPVLRSQSIYFSYSISDGGQSYDGPYVPCSGTPATDSGRSTTSAAAAKPAVFKVPGSGTLTANLVICTG
jgi:hypothetical protein